MFVFVAVLCLILQHTTQVCVCVFVFVVVLCLILWHAAQVCVCVCCCCCFVFDSMACYTGVCVRLFLLLFCV